MTDLRAAICTGWWSSISKPTSPCFVNANPPELCRRKGCRTGKALAAEPLGADNPRIDTNLREFWRVRNSLTLFDKKVVDYMVKNGILLVLTSEMLVETNNNRPWAALVMPNRD